MKPILVAGATVLVPQQFDRWGRQQQNGYLAQRRVFAAEGDVVSFAYESVQVADRADAERDPWETAASVLSAAMALSRHAASKLVATAVELCERLPRTATLLVAGWIGLTSAHLIAAETRIVDDDKVDALDQLIAESLAPTRRRTHAPRLGPLRKMLGKAVARCDPVGAAARARQAREQVDVRMDAIGDDQALISATVSTDVGVEIMDRIDAIVRTTAADDTRSFGQLRAAGLLALSRGWTTLPELDGSHPGDPDAEAASRRVVIHVYEVDGETNISSYGRVTDTTAADLQRTAVRRVEKVSDLADRARFSALRYSPSESLRAFCRGRDGTCVFPGCQIDADHCDLDHIVPFDHADPENGGRTTSDDLAGLCRTHHRLKTEGIWAYYRDVDGSYVWMHGVNHPSRDPGTRVHMEPAGPLAQYGAPHDPASTDRQRAAAEAGATGGTGGTVKRQHLRDRRRAERRRLRAEVAATVGTVSARATVSSGGAGGTVSAGGTTVDSVAGGAVAGDPPPF